MMFPPFLKILKLTLKLQNQFAPFDARSPDKTLFSETLQEPKFGYAHPLRY